MTSSPPLSRMRMVTSGLCQGVPCWRDKDQTVGPRNSPWWARSAPAHFPEGLKSSRGRVQLQSTVRKVFNCNHTCDKKQVWVESPFFGSLAPWYQHHQMEKDVQKYLQPVKWFWFQGGKSAQNWRFQTDWNLWNSTCEPRPNIFYFIYIYATIYCSRNWNSAIYIHIIRNGSSLRKEYLGCPVLMWLVPKSHSATLVNRCEVAKTA